MATSMMYILKINGILFSFPILYYTVLQRIGALKFNRFFLTAGLVFSIGFSLYKLPDVFKNEYLNLKLSGFLSSIIVVKAEVNIYLESILFIIFLIGMLIMTIRLIMQLVLVRRIHKNSIPAEIEGVQVRLIIEEIPPLTFCRNIYLNAHLYKPEHLKKIIEYEKIHVNQLHTVDIFIAQLCGIVYWYNPGVWMIKKMIRENIEKMTRQIVSQQIAEN